jgi:hypothetical protein
MAFIVLGSAAAKPWCIIMKKDIKGAFIQMLMQEIKMMEYVVRLFLELKKEVECVDVYTCLC